MTYDSRAPKKKAVVASCAGGTAFRLVESRRWPAAIFGDYSVVGGPHLRGGRPRHVVELAFGSHVGGYLFESAAFGVCGYAAAGAGVELG